MASLFQFNANGGNTRGRLLGLVGAVALSIATIMPASAAGTVQQVINCGASNSFASSLNDTQFQAKSFSTAAQDSTGALTLSAAEIGCNAQGWKVLVQASNWTGGPSTIPATAFEVTSSSNIQKVSGQDLSPAGGPKAPPASEFGTLNQSRKVLLANNAFGLGAYTAELGLKLTIPALTMPGTYQSTVTVTMSAQP